MACAALLLTTLSVKASPVPSPDGRFAIETGAGLDLVDSEGRPVMLLTRSLNGSERVEVSWSPDSRRVVIVTRTARGSAVLGAWHDASAWHKTIQTDDLPDLKRLTSKNGDLEAEQRSLGDWTSPDTITVRGALLFHNGKSLQYRYLLKFSTTTVSLDRGGFEEGAMRGVDYQVQ
jgi:hypothetical protein